MFRVAMLGSAEYGVFPVSVLMPSMDESEIAIGEKLDRVPIDPRILSTRGDGRVAPVCNTLAEMSALRVLGFWSKFAQSLAYLFHP
jgi:hypothetical protein